MKFAGEQGRLRKLLGLLILPLISSAVAAQPQGVWGERGISKRFVVRGSLLYAADGRGVSVYDVANPAAIRKVDVESGDAESTGLAFAGDNDLVVATSQGIDRFSVNPDGTLARLTSIEVQGGVSHIAATASHVIVAADRTLMIFQRSASGLALQDQTLFEQTIRALTVSGNVAFAAVQRAAIYAIDINSAETINTIAVDALDLAVSGSTLWAAADVRGLFAVDVATQNVLGVTGAGEFRLSRIAASGSRVYAVEAPDRVHFFDGSRPSDPRLIATMTDWVNVIAASGSRMFVAGAIIDAQGFSYETGAPLRIYDTTNASAPVRLGEYRDLAGPVSGVWTDGSIAYVIDPPYLRVIDISKTDQPKEMSSVLVPDIQDHIRVKNGLAINYGRLFVVLIDVSSPREPKVMGKWFTQGGGKGFAALLRDTFVEANQYSGLHIVDYSDPANPVQIAGRIFHYYDAAAGDDAVYTLQNVTFLTLDLTDRTKVVDRAVHSGRYLQLDTMPPNAAFPHHVVLRSGTGVAVFSLIEDRFQPRPLGFVPLSGIELLGTSDTSVFAVSGARLHRLDIPGGTAFVETTMVVTSPMQISVAGEKVVVADRYRLRVYGPDTAPPPPVRIRRRAVAH